VEARIAAFLGPRVAFQLEQTTSIALGSHGKSQAFRPLAAGALPTAGPGSGLTVDAAVRENSRHPRVSLPPPGAGRRGD
jgi:hypothetical protein